MPRFYLINKGEVYAFVHVNNYVFNINTYFLYVTRHFKHFSDGKCPTSIY